MTNDDLHQQARVAALLSTPLSTPYAEDQCWYDNDALRDEFVAGFLAAAEPRETELIELRPKLADRNKRLAAAFEKHDVLCAEIDTLSVRVAEMEVEHKAELAAFELELLKRSEVVFEEMRAKLASIPVEEITKAVMFCRGHQSASVHLDTIDRWLAGLKEGV